MVAGSAAFSICESKMDLLAFDSPDDGINAANMHNITSEPAKVHVAFSRKSAVLRTPMIWLDDEKLAAKPPPFEFCTNTISVKNTQTTTIIMDINVYMNFLFFTLLTCQFGLQSKYVFPDISKLNVHKFQ